MSVDDIIISRDIVTTYRALYNIRSFVIVRFSRKDFTIFISAKIQRALKLKKQKECKFENQKHFNLILENTKHI